MIAIVFLLIAGWVFLSGLLIMWLWNWIIVWLIPSVPVITYWKAFGVMLILNIIGGIFKTYKYRKEN